MGGIPKLNSKQALELARELLKQGRGSPVRLAPKYGVSQSVCHQMLAGAIWKKEMSKARREAQAALCNCPCCLKHRRGK